MESKLVDKIFPSDANFLLIRFFNSKKIFDYLTNKKIIIRDRSKVKFCENCLRLTIGSKEENETFLLALKNFK